ncbi:MAG: HAD family hydrolase [Magnetococcales bacterium]|nr:HAD family hydrolase [Magnetococcales bacterium]
MDEIFTELDQDGSINAYQQAANRLAGRGGWGGRPLSMALLSSFVVHPYLPTLTVEAARFGFEARCQVAPFDNVIQELIDPARATIQGKPDVVLIMRTLHSACPPLASQFLSLSAEEVGRLIAETVEELLMALRRFREQAASAVIVHGFVLPAHPPLGILEGGVATSQTEAIRRLNQEMSRQVRAIPGVHYLDFDRVCARIGYANSQDDTWWYMARAPLSARLMPELAREQAIFCHALWGRVRKCLVLDLDNTLWGGVIGEDGMAGIALGHTGLGLVFREFQESVLALQRRGVLLAVASKNNLDDAMAVLRDHPEMLLRPEHFAAMRIDWRPKPENILEIAQELNIGLDSLVFWDDSPQERLWMRAARPEVLTPELPANPMLHATRLRQLGVFDKLTLTGEDLQRGEMYRHQQDREALRATAGSLEAFHRGLAMRVTIRPVEETTFARVLDLIHKTNQFNLSTRRHDAQTLRTLLEDPACGVFGMRVADKFGDYGLVGVAILHLAGEVVELDTLLMSCRVIGRNVERAFLADLCAWSRQRGATRMEADFIPTAKNQPVARFLPEQGFMEVGRHEASSRWACDLTQAILSWPDYIERGV